MSDIPVATPATQVDLDEKMGTRTPSATFSLADYEDISGEFQQPLSRTSSIATQVAPEELAQPPVRTLSATKEVETEDEDEHEEQPEPEPEPELQQQQLKQNNAGADLAAPMIIFGGIVLAGLALFLNRPLTIEHPLTRGDYF